MSVDQSLFCLLGFIAGANLGVLSVVVRTEWPFIRGPQKSRYASLFGASLVFVVAAIFRGIGNEHFIPRFYLSLAVSVLCLGSSLWSLVDNRRRDDDLKVALLRLEQRR